MTFGERFHQLVAGDESWRGCCFCWALHALVIQGKALELPHDAPVANEFRGHLAALVRLDGKARCN